MWNSATTLRRQLDITISASFKHDGIQILAHGMVPRTRALRHYQMSRTPVGLQFLLGWR